MPEKETFTIVSKTSGYHYDTNDQRFYSENWERTQDDRKYLERLMENDPKKFKGCEIQNNE